MEQAGSLLLGGTCHTNGQIHPVALAVLAAFTCVQRQNCGCARVRCTSGERGRGVEAGAALETRHK